MANLTALAAARHAKAGFDVRSRGLQSGDQRLVVYMSEEGHGCIRKAAELIRGLAAESLRVVPVNDRSEMRVNVLAETIDRDLQAGYRPIAVAASAGTVNTGAINDLEAIAGVCRERRRLVARRRGIRSRRYFVHAVSRSVFFARPWPTASRSTPTSGCMCRSRRASSSSATVPSLRSAFSLVPPYLRTDGDPHGVGGPPWFSEFGFQQSRGFRAAQGQDDPEVLRDSPATPAQWITTLPWPGCLPDRVNADADLELMAPPSLSIVCFRAVPAGVVGDERLNDLNKHVLERLQLSGRAFLSSTVLLFCASSSAPAWSIRCLHNVMSTQCWKR